MIIRQTRRASRPAASGFTLVELLVVIAIIGVLIGMSIPAIQNMRELARRSSCQQNLFQISLAMSNYASQHGHYPIGTLAESGPILSAPDGFHHNWISGLLPMMDLQVVDQKIDRSVSVYATANDPVRKLSLPVLLCPSASGIRSYTTCYAGIHASSETPIDGDNNGVFILNQPISDAEITDGLSYTLFVGEKLSDFIDDLGWLSGTRSSLRNAGHAINAERYRIRAPQQPQQTPPLYVGGIASDHPAGAFLLMGGGECQFRSDTMDQQLLQQMASRAGNEIPEEFKTSD